MCRKLTYVICSIFVLGLFPVARADLVAWWQFDEGVGTVVADSSKNGHDGVINGNPVWTTGVYGSALAFDGTGDYVLCDLLDIDTSVTGGLTVCGWIKRPSGGDTKLCSNRQAADAAGGGFTCAIYNERMEMDICGATARTLARDGGGNTVPTDTWVHVAWVFDDAGNLLSEYHNCVLSDSDAVTVSVGVSTARFRIAADSPTIGIYYLGSMDDWRVYNHVLSETELRKAMAGKGPYDELATKPSPENGATEVIRDVVLSWRPSEVAAARDVYLGTALADVENADRDNPMGVLVSEGQEETAFDAGRLEFGMTYYWRIDEVNDAPDHTVFKGKVWSFATESYSYRIGRDSIMATASSQATGMGPEKTIDESGLDLTTDRHSADTSTMWFTTSTGPHWIRYAFDKVYVLDELWVWNYNTQIESTVHFGAKQVSVEYSLDGLSWTMLEGVPEFAPAPGTDACTADTTVEFGGVMARYVRLNIESTWGGGSFTGLSEVRFYYLPMAASVPSPEDGAADASPETILSWRAGRQAASHEIFLGTDANDLSLVGTTDEAAYQADLKLGETYFWKVVEVNEAEATPRWEGEVWSFSTVAAFLLEGFESYTDDMDAGEAIFQTWTDGYEIDTNGSQVGYGRGPFAEQRIGTVGSSPCRSSTTTSNKPRMPRPRGPWTPRRIGPDTGTRPCRSSSLAIRTTPGRCT